MDNGATPVADDMESMGDKIVKEMEADLKTSLRSVPRPSLSQPRQAPRMPSVSTLSDQLMAYERVQVELKDRFRREAMRLEHEYKQRRQSLLADYDVRIHEAVIQLEQRREKELVELGQEFHDKAREMDALLKRLEG